MKFTAESETREGKTDPEQELTSSSGSLFWLPPSCQARLSKLVSTSVLSESLLPQKGEQKSCPVIVHPPPHQGEAFPLPAVLRKH